MVSSKGRKTKEKSGSNEGQNKKTGNKAFKVGLVAILLSYSAYMVLDETGLLDFGFGTGSLPMTSTSVTLGDTVSNASGNVTEKPSSQAGVTDNRNTFQAKDVPLVDVQSFDKLSALYLLSERVQTSNKPAAELYGLTRLSIHAKRNQAIETELLAKKSKYELEYQKNQSEIKNIVDGKGSQVETDSEPRLVEPDYPINNGTGFPIDVGLDSRLGGTSESVSSDLGGEDEELSKQVYLPSNFALRGMVNDRASLAIKGKMYDSVRRGQRVLARFEITQFNYELDCVTIKDHVDDSSFITCLN